MMQTAVLMGPVLRPVPVVKGVGVEKDDQESAWRTEKKAKTFDFSLCDHENSMLAQTETDLMILSCRCNRLVRSITFACEHRRRGP